MSNFSYGFKELSIAAMLATSIFTTVGVTTVGKPVPLVVSSSASLTTSGSASTSTSNSKASARANAKAAAVAAQEQKQQAKQQQLLKALQTRANAEIARRITSLNALYNVIKLDSRLTSSQQSNLEGQVTSTINGLNTIKDNVDAATTLQAAQQQAQQIILEFRVYALLTPQTYLLRAADDQIDIEAKLTTIAQDISKRLTTIQNAGSMTITLATMNSEISNAQSISLAVSTQVGQLTAADYNTNHAVLSGYLGQLKVAAGDIQKADQDGRSIIQQIFQSKSTSSGSNSTTPNSKTPTTPVNTSS